MFRNEDRRRLKYMKNFNGNSNEAIKTSQQVDDDKKKSKNFNKNSNVQIDDERSVNESTKYMKNWSNSNERFKRSHDQDDYGKKKLKNFRSNKNSDVIQCSHDERSMKLNEFAKNKLMASKFRFINEYLYSHSSSDSQKYMTEELFNTYHDTYDKLMEKWPIKPIHHIINQIKVIYSKRFNKITIADLGCGKLPLIKLNIPSSTVHSYDLVSNHPYITACDIAKLPLDKVTCDCVVYSLSLMNTNLKDCLYEANRILKLDGRMLIVEVVSRFEDKSDQFIELIEKFGFKLKSKTLLPPNSYFIYFDFVKNSKCNNKSKLPDVILKPCSYKTR